MSFSFLGLYPRRRLNLKCCLDRLLIELESKLLKGGYRRDYVGEYYRGCGCKGDTRSLDYSLCG